jgi:hypothetical protein
MIRNSNTSCETVSGVYVDVVNPDPASIELTDIAWSLSRQARFAGHTKSTEIWSVAQHALFVEFLVHRLLTEDSLKQSYLDWRHETDGIAADTGMLELDYDGQELRTVLLGALHHDDSEAYLVDLPSPVKRHPALRAPYKQLEDGVTEAINIALCLPTLSARDLMIIHWADLFALRIEAWHLMPSKGNGWNEGLPETSIENNKLFPVVKRWRDTYADFLVRHTQLMRTD